MILRKLTGAVTEHNWFTVALEVLIVVVGIFIALQVDDWNETRKNRVREIEFLQRIDAELEQDTAQFEHGVTLAKQRSENAQVILAALAEPETIQDDPTGFIRSLVQAGLTYSPIVSDHTFQEVKAAGELGIIGDVTLRSAITVYYQGIRQYEQWNYLRELNQTQYLKRQAGILTPAQFQAFWVSGDGSANITMEDAGAAYERLLKKPAFIDWLPITVAFLDQNVSYHQSARGSAEKLRKKIAAYIGQGSDQPRE